jgi:hypothetical protein
MILHYNYNMHTYLRFAKHLCLNYTSGQQHALYRGFMFVAQCQGTSFTPGYCAHIPGNHARQLIVKSDYEDSSPLPVTG